MTLQSMCRGDLLPGPRDKKSNPRVWHECVSCGKQRLALWRNLARGSTNCKSCGAIRAKGGDPLLGICPNGHSLTTVGRSGGSGRCLECCRESDRRRYANGTAWARQPGNKDRVREINLRSAKKRYSEGKMWNQQPENRERMRELQRDLYLANPERYRDIGRKSYYRHLAKRRAEVRAWHAANKEYRVEYKRRRDGWYDEGGMATDQEMEALRGFAI